MKLKSDEPILTVKPGFWDGLFGRKIPIYESMLPVQTDTGVTDFKYEPEMFEHLSLKVVDDVDVEWFLRQQYRVDTQYQNGWRDFLSKYGGHIALVIVCTLILIGYIVYLKEVPSLTEQCTAAGVEAAKNTYLKDIAGRAGISTPGPTTSPPPPGG